MTEYDNTNRGVLFKNDRKESDKHPDYKGNINVNGVEFWLSAWIKDGAKGKFMSLSIQPKEEQKPAPKRADPISSGRSLKADMDDDIPFSSEWR
jgi:hypothetical protein